MINMPAEVGKVRQNLLPFAGRFITDLPIHKFSVCPSKVSSDQLDMLSKTNAISAGHGR